MLTNSILAPVFALVLLTFAVLLLMAKSRLSALRRKGVHPQVTADPQRFDEVFRDAENHSDNFMNLFEMPVLFYAACVVIYLTAHVDVFFVALAWTYVVLRVIHTIVHISYNNVLHRFHAYWVSCAVLFLIWARLAVLVFLR